MTDLVLATYASAVIEIAGLGTVDLPAPKSQVVIDDIVFFVGAKGDAGDEGPQEFQAERRPG